MTTIDHRILIPASPDAVWHYLSNIQRNPEWQVDCRSVSFLTTQHDGPGTRWRYTSDKQRDYVIEVLTWYDRIGYEYQIVDGGSFKENKGVIRLQEIPEGTIVQWTFTYETSGLLGRSSFGSKRQIDTNMAESLRTLYRRIKNELESGEHEAKSLMREAPDVEQRAAYRPRHPSRFSERTSEQPIVRDGRLVSEPRPAEDDTRPNPAAAPAAESPAPAQQEEDLFMRPDSATETATSSMMIEPPVEAAPAAALQADQPAENAEAEHPTPDPVITEHESAEEASAKADESLPAKTRQEEAIPEINTPAAQHALQPPSVEPLSTTEAEIQSLEEKPASELDTARISVFDLFGIPKPSETQEMRKVAERDTQEHAAAVPATAPAAEQVPPVEPTAAITRPAAPVSISRTGLRVRLRRRRTHLRRPG
jgi:uncharacterized membrane protein